MLCELCKQLLLQSAVKNDMWHRKVECALNALVKVKLESKEKLCVNYTVVTVDESIFRVLKTEHHHLSKLMDYKHQVFLSVCIYTGLCLKSTS